MKPTEKRNVAVDILIAGGGPAGAALAALAAEAGARVTIVERDSFPRDKVCGEFVSVEGRGVLERLGVLDDLLARGATRMDSVRISTLGGRDLRAFLPELPGVGRPALGCSRGLLDATLLDRARRAGATVHERTEAHSPIVEDGRVRGFRIRAIGSAREGETVRAGVTVAADGRRSVLVRALHPRLGDPHRTGPGSWFGLATHVESAPARLGGRVELHLFDGGYAGLGTVEDRRINLCLMVQVRALRACGGRPERVVRERVLANPMTREALGDSAPPGPWKCVGPLRFGVRRPTAAGALFVGDAAGTVDPFCGEGIAHALRAAELALPHALEAAARGRLTRDLAAAYRSSWMRAFAPVTRRVRRTAWVLERHRAGRLVARVLSWTSPAVLAALVAASRTGRAAVAGPEPLPARRRLE